MGEMENAVTMEKYIEVLC